MFCWHEMLVFNSVDLSRVLLCGLLAEGFLSLFPYTQPPCFVMFFFSSRSRPNRKRDKNIKNDPHYLNQMLTVLDGVRKMIRHLFPI